MDTKAIAQSQLSEHSSHHVEDEVRNLLSNSVHFAGRVDGFTFSHADDLLVIEGVVPTYYLKQLLQQLIGSLHDIQRIDNRVKVVSCDGLSGDRPADCAKSPASQHYIDNATGDDLA
ncbi:hypothetical protein [Lacipirellula parvula]|uniref:BON domain-containing protein n=1 Tax=Lacipirellula parvula TaxID=2650471 RepID=A0A5K7X6Q7_9BACT|nr:hypothetical protein [Lacipirellula parvula]BBO32270.1 hypothetical protein PLANPX_1882 [Lacipirellula parvula]